MLEVVDLESLRKENSDLRRVIEKQTQAHENEVFYLEKYIEKLSNHSSTLLKNSNETLFQGSESLIDKSMEK